MVAEGVYMTGNRTIYVDYSQKTVNKQGIALIELTNGTPTRYASVRTKGIAKASIGEMRGVIMALKELKSTGGTIMTDQLSIIEDLLEQGCVASNNYPKAEKEEFNRLIKTGGFVIQHSKAHDGHVDPINLATDQLAKLAAGIRCFTKANEFGQLSKVKLFNRPNRQLTWRTICG